MPSDGRLDKRTADMGWVDDLVAQGLLTSEQAAAASRRLREATPTRWLADRLMALTGASLILAGIVFFFAYNWHVMPALQKFAVIELALILCVVIALRRGLDDLVGRLFVLAASVFVGVFLAVLGQVYQTGADPWQLFAAWAALTLPWCALVPFAPLWALLVTVIDTGLCLYINEMLPSAALALPCLGIALTHGLFLLAREAVARRRDDFAQETWLRQFLLAGSLGALTVPSCALVASWQPEQPLDVVNLGLWAVITSTVWRFYTHRSVDMIPLAMASLSTCLVTVWFLGGILLGRHSNPVVWLVFGLIVMGVFSIAANILRGLQARMRAEARDVE